MFKIIGADQKEYGPIAAEQLRQWIADGRVNRQTRVQLEGDTAWKTLAAFPEFDGALGAKTVPPPIASSEVGAAVSTIIPYKNVQALIAYYLAVFSVIPCFGLVLGLAAFVLGLRGLKCARENPEAKGKVHAWIGIILGGLCGFGNLILIIALIASKSLR